MFGLPAARPYRAEGHRKHLLGVGIVDLWCMCLEAAGRIALPSSQGIIACCSERGRNNPRMFVLICNSYDSSLQNYVAIVRRRWFWSNHD